MPTWHVCDRNGALVRDVTAVALDKTLRMRKSRTCTAEFKLPASLATGLSGNTTLKVFDDGPAIRFAGDIMTIEEDQGPESGTVTVTAADFFHRLFSRFVVTVSGLWRRPATPTWTNVAANVVINEMVDRSIATHGALGIAGGSATANTLINAGPFRQEKVGKAIVDICDMGIADVWMAPMDRTDGLLNRMHTFGSQGGASGAVFEYGVGAKNVNSFRRLVDRTKLANDITYYGEGFKPVAGKVRTDPGSISTWGRHLDARFVHQISDAVLVGLLADQELAVRKAPREVVSFEPVPEIAPQPFTSWFLGDTVTFAADGPNVREAFTGQMRVHGFTLVHENNGPVVVREIQLSANG